jgi:hypothetical protein
MMFGATPKQGENLLSRGLNQKIAISVLLLFLMLPIGQAYQGGISGGVISNGCSCHGDGVASDNVEIAINGLPGNWNYSQSYTFTISATTDVSATNGLPQGGLNVMSNIGSLSSLDNSTQIQNLQLTHTDEGNEVRNWTVEWHAPSSGHANLELRIIVNTVDGDGVPDSDDHWNVETISVLGPTTEPVHGNDADSLFSSQLPMIVLLISIILIINFKQIFGSLSNAKKKRELR